mmetsp:Transcript_3403/g.11421  ORF Transcript_3403/g.11421 Transcript_3403/m.11421 type:complete len:411 (+) Transcript_3403:3-1235(+)
MAWSPADNREPERFACASNAALERSGFPCRVARGPGGLAMYAARPITAGEVLLHERPLALTVCRGARSYRCALCLSDSRADGSPSWTLGCPHCLSMAYCSAVCAAAALAFHAGSGECEALRKAVADPDVDDGIFDQVAQAIRILSLKQAGLSPDCGPAGPLGYSAYAARLVGSAPECTDARLLIRRAVRATLAALPPRARVAEAEALHLLIRHHCNTFGLSGMAGEDVASASFVGFMHLFNHACCPNAAFDSAMPVMPADVGTAAPPSFGIVAMEPIPAGGEICISYACSAVGPATRAAFLLDQYGFRCSCRRCECDDPLDEIGYDEILDARRCAIDECGSGFGVPCLAAAGSLGGGPHNAAGAQGEEDGRLVARAVGGGGWAQRGIVAANRLRCVHCAGEWEVEAESDE